MNVLILMAGEGKRFRDQGIDTPKPLIEVNGKPILEWTTRSLPFIRHYDEILNDFISPESLYFAVRQDQEALRVSTRLQEIYGDEINFIEFQKTTRGNLETAYICSTMMDETDSLLVLDSDNKYNHNGLLDTLVSASELQHSMVVCNFEPLDTSTKWAFTITNGNLVTEIVEKDPLALQKGGKPMVGTFWFDSTRMFMDFAEFIIKNNLRTGVPGKEEFYLSQVPSLHAKNGGTVFAHTVTEMTPLGTPEDVAEFSHKSLRV
jgi:NDP-sugar pyrophosphorylase family protein